MARARQPSTKTVETLEHDEAKRKNIPTAECESVVEKEAMSPVRVAYERRNRDLDPQLVWRGKDEQNWSDLVVQAPPLYTQEKVHPKALIDDLLRQSKERTPGTTADLFADFNGIPGPPSLVRFAFQPESGSTSRDERRPKECRSMLPCEPPSWPGSTRPSGHRQRLGLSAHGACRQFLCHFDEQPQRA